MVVRRDIPRAYAGAGSGSAVVGRAVRWLSSLAAEIGGQPLLYVPGRRNVGADPAIERLSKQLPTSTWKTLTSTRWSGGPVLAAWPDRKHLADIDGHTRTTALCVIGWSDDDTAGWLAAYQPTLLASADAPTTAPAISDPVVVEGMKRLTAMVNHANNLAGPLDKRDAVDVLMRLRDAGHDYDPEALYAWALAHGWNPRGAERLRELASKAAAGTRLRRGMPSALREDIVQVWRDVAAEPPPA
jgi:hypothetical protein